MLQAKTDVVDISGVLRLLQLFCEGHHLGMQNYLREQSEGSSSVNIVNQVMWLLKEVWPVCVPRVSVGDGGGQGCIGRRGGTPPPCASCLVTTPPPEGCIRTAVHRRGRGGYPPPWTPLSPPPSSSPSDV